MVKLNLFDANFRQQPWGSVLGKKPQYIEYVRDRMEWDGVTLFTDAYILNPVVDEVKCPVKVGWLREPECLWPGNYSGAVEVIDKFDFIMTYHQGLLNLSPKFRFLPYGGIWIKEQDYGLAKKTRLCSMLYGDKMATEGHRIRQEIAALVNVDFFGKKGQAVGYGAETKLRVNQDYAFSVVTETCRQDNLFTEWLLDCFIVGTVPVYWGCPNLPDFFDPQGVLSFETADEAVEIVSTLSFELYKERLDSITDNYYLAKNYEVTEDRLFFRFFEGLDD